MRCGKNCRRAERKIGVAGFKDKFGLSWQIIPTALGELLGDKDAEKSGRVMKAMLQMSKIDIGRLKQAYGQE